MMALNAKEVLLVHPLGYRAEAARQDISRIANLMPPIGLISIAAYLEKRGIRTTVIDCYARPDSDLRIRDALVDRRPAFVGFSCTTSGFLDAVRLIRLAKRALPGVKAVVGGPHVSALKSRTLAEFPEVDFGVVGEGEQTLAELVESGAETPAGVEGLVYRDGDGVRFTGYRGLDLELDSLPFPAYEKLEGYPDLYKLPIFNYPTAPNTSCVSSRGCPYQCTYCDRSVFRRSFRANSAAYIYELLHHLKDRFRIRHVNFYDDQFTFDRKRIRELAGALIERPLGITFNCAARAEHLDMELLRDMKSAGCWMISLGIESGDPDLLAQHRQNANLELLREKIDLIKQAGIRVKGLLMIGLPGESEASVRKSMEYVYSLPLDEFNLAKFTPFPGSPIYEGIRERGTFDEDWEKLDCMHFQFIPKGMSRDQLDRLFQDFYRGYFMRPRMLWAYTTMIWRSPDSWRRFWLSAGRFLRFAATNRRLGEKET